MLSRVIAPASAMVRYRPIRVRRVNRTGLIAVNTPSRTISRAGNSQRGCRPKRSDSKSCRAREATTAEATGRRFSGPVGRNQAGTHSVSTARLSPPRYSSAHPGREGGNAGSACDETSGFFSLAMATLCAADRFLGHGDVAPMRPMEHAVTEPLGPGACGERPRSLVLRRAAQELVPRVTVLAQMPTLWGPVPARKHQLDPWSPTRRAVVLVRATRLV